LFSDKKICDGLIIDAMHRVDCVLAPVKVGYVLSAWALAGEILFTVWESRGGESDMGVSHNGFAIRMK
jgi:hypothetical protein